MRDLNTAVHLTLDGERIHDSFCRCAECKPGSIQAARDTETLRRVRVALAIAASLVFAVIIARAIG